ncbi:MAG: type II toxin-antitoxin system RelE/ParE family toxin [Acetobacteraceae bacterium]
MIISIKGLGYTAIHRIGEGKFRGLDTMLAEERLAQLNAATRLSDLTALSSIGLHKLKGSLREFWSIDVNAGWRIFFKFRNGNASEVQIFDPH